jgi:hypothetical protein
LPTRATGCVDLNTDIPRAVVESATRREPLLKAMRSSFLSIMGNPYRFFATPAFRPMLLLYGGTYIAANASDTFHSVAEDLPAEHTESNMTKLCAVTVVNLGLSLYKDAQFAKNFGPPSALAIPLMSYIPFVVRDCITLSASFYLPARLAPSLPEGWNQYMSRTTIAQLIAPALSQWVATPLHLLALDLHARRGHLPAANRVKAVARLWPSSSTARMCRVIPAYGFGAVVNNRLRTYLMRHFG